MCVFTWKNVCVSVHVLFTFPWYLINVLLFLSVCIFKLLECVCIYINIYLEMQTCCMLVILIITWYYALWVFCMWLCECLSSSKVYSSLWICTQVSGIKYAHRQTCMSEILKAQTHSRTRTHPHTPAHTLELRSRRVWGLTLSRSSSQRPLSW
jgi:hypothetical protein